MVNKDAMYRRMIRDFHQNHEIPLLKEKKKILEDIRLFKKPIDHKNLDVHMNQYKDFQKELKEH